MKSRSKINLNATYIICMFVFFGSNLTTQITAQQVFNIAPQWTSEKWDAQWISHPQSNEQYGVYNFHKSFDLKEVPEEFVIHISADNRYWLHVNGKRICTGPAKGDISNWYFESLDISCYLHKGSNILAITVWNYGDYRPAWQQTYKTGLVVQGNSMLESVVNTDTTWKVAENNAYYPLYDGYKFIGAREAFFAIKHPFGWEQHDANDDIYKRAIVSEDAVPVGLKNDHARKLIQSKIPFPEEIPQRFASVRKMQKIPFSDDFIKGKGDLRIHPWGKVKILVDQEKLTTAYPELLFSGGKGARITLTYMEAPFINVAQEHKGNRNEVEGKIVHGYYDVVYPNGDSNILYRPLYYRTFRYVEIEIENYLQPLIIHDFSSRFTGYPFHKVADFKSSDSSLTDIWNVGWRTARLCAYDGYMDCPYYEQLQYIGDTRIQALISLYMTGDDRLMRNAINQFHLSRIDEGLTQSRYPSIFRQVIPPFSLFWAHMVHDYWMHKPDTLFVKQYLEGIIDVLEWHKSKIDRESGMLGKLDFWNFVDWPKEWPWLGYDEISGVPKGSADGNSSIHTLQFIYAINKSVELFEAFGMKDEASEYKEIAASLKENTYRLCWDSNKKMMAGVPDKSEFSQHANVMSVLTGIPDSIDARDLMNRTIADTSIVECTVYYRFYLNQAMEEAGLADKYVDLLTPWRDMLSLGLTTFAEKPEPSRSDCHAWSASPNYDLLAKVLGVKPGSPGFKTVKIEPHLGALQFAEGKVPSPQGIIDVEIQRIGSLGMKAHIILPKGMNGEFHWNEEKIKITEGKQLIER